MKNQSITIVLLLLFFGLTVQQVNGQSLREKLCGTWNITKYQSSTKMQGRSGTLIFQADGLFQSEGIPFGIKTGLFMIDETNSIVTIEIEKTKTAWTASEKNGVLRLQSYLGSKKSRVFITLMKLKVDVATQ